MIHPRTLLLLAAVSLTACPSAEPEPEPEPTPPSTDGQARLLLVGDYAEGAATTFPGLATVPNIDDDNDNGTPDWRESEAMGLSDEEDDLASFIVPASVWIGIQASESFVLNLNGEVRNFRVWHEGEIVLGEVEGDNLESWPVPQSDEDLEFFVEARAMLGQSWLALERLVDGESTETAWTFITTSPLILNHHLQQTEHVWVVDIPPSGSSPQQRLYNNQHMIEAYEDVLGEQFTPVPGNQYYGDVWIQDEIQLAWMNSPTSRTDLIIDSIRDRGLDDFPEDYIVGDGTDLAPNVVNEAWGIPQQANSLDSFGNLEISPPVTVDGVHYPFGRIYWGGSANRYPSRELTDFLASQRIQKPFMPDTSWLCVGHIDEVTAVVPDPASELGFKFVLSDVPVAYEILDAMDPSTALPRFAPAPAQYGHNIATVGEMVNNSALRMENEEIQEDILDPMREQFKAELGITDDDILLMPSLFESVPNCGDAALIPGMVNLIVTNRGEQTDVFLSDPFVRDSEDSDVGRDEDPILNHVIEMMPDTLDLHFVDNWAVYHANLGEVHCGTNQTRTPAADWWSVAGHLLEEE